MFSSLLITHLAAECGPGSTESNRIDSNSSNSTVIIVYNGLIIVTVVCQACQQELSQSLDDRLFAFDRHCDRHL
jgi:hypothetical protein